jgi:hypothetical protein
MRAEPIPAKNGVELAQITHDNERLGADKGRGAGAEADFSAQATKAMYFVVAGSIEGHIARLNGGTRTTSYRISYETVRRSRVDENARWRRAKLAVEHV